MKKAIIAGLLSLLGPGLGQIYNREYKKGWILIGVSTLLFLGPMIWMVKNIGLVQPGTDVLEVKARVENVVKAHSHSLMIIQFIFLGFWAYAITQAYFKGRELNPENPPPEPES